MNKAISAATVEQIIHKYGGKVMEDLELFDVYEGERVAEGLKSLAFALRFRASDHTLTDEEINAVMDKIIEKLNEKDIDLRS